MSKMSILAQKIKSSAGEKKSAVKKVFKMGQKLTFLTCRRPRINLA